MENNQSGNDGSETQIQKSIIYLGHDTGYLDDLTKGFRKNFPNITNTFVTIQEKDPDKIQMLYQKILNASPKLVIVDLSLNGKDYLQLVRLIIRVNATKNVPVIAIFDDLNSKLIPASVISGVKYNFLKTSDFYTISRAMARSINPEEVGEAQLATATLNDKVTAYECCQISFLNEELIHIELNKELKKDEMVKLKTMLQTNGIVPSMEMDLIETSEKGLFYNYEYSATLKYRFVDQLDTDGMDEQKIKEAEAEREYKIRQAQVKLKKWIEDNQNNLPEKYLRTMIVERELSFLNREERTDSYDFLIRVHPYLLEFKKEIQQLLPHIIFYQFDLYEDEEDKPLYTNDLTALKSLIAAIKEHKDYEPFVTVFNSHLGSQTLKDECDYKNIIAYDKPLEVEIAIKIVEMIRSKMKDTFAKISALSPLFIKKDWPGAMAEIQFHIKLMKMNEAEIMFETEYPLKAGQVLHLADPLNMYACISHESFERPEIKKAYLSGASELDLAGVRRFINGVFFREKEAQRKEEQEAFEKQKKEALRKKQQAEEEAKKAAEEAKKKKDKEKEEGAKTSDDKADKSEQNDNQSKDQSKTEGE